MATLVCDIVTPEKKELSEECHMVSVPGSAGSMGFLPGHAPLLSTLADGEVRIFSDDSTLSHRYACQGGYVQVTGEKVIILADRVLAAEDINASEVANQVKELQKQLESMPEDDGKRSVTAYDLKWFQTLEKVAANQ